jgi:hypothetical protein
MNARDFQTNNADPSEELHPAGKTVDLSQIAHLISTGQMPWPSDLDEEELHLVCQSIRDDRLNRFLRLVGKAIARDLRAGFQIQDRNKL